MEGKTRRRKPPSHRDLVRAVSKQMKYYFEVRRQEDGFDLSGPDCPRPHYPALKSRPMLLYEGLHDRQVKHFFSDKNVKAQITHMSTEIAPTTEQKRVKKLMRKDMDKVSFAPKPLTDYMDELYDGKPPWMGVGMYGTSHYTKNSEKYIPGTFGEWTMKSQSTKKRGFGNPEPTKKSAFKGERKVLRSTVPGWIDNRECNRLVDEASKILASSEITQAGAFLRPQTASSYRSSASTSNTARSSVRRPRSASPVSARTGSSIKSESYLDKRKSVRQQQRSSKIHSSSAISYSQAKDDVVKSHEQRKTDENMEKGKIYYDVDGRRHPRQYKVKNADGYLDDEPSPRKENDSDVPEWLRNRMRGQDVDEKRLPYNRSVKPVEVEEKETHQGEDIKRRIGVRRRPRSARHDKATARSTSRERRASLSLSEGSYEEVNLDDSESEDEYVEDKACQTGWELLVQYDQNEHLLHEQEQADYRIIVRTGETVGASTKAPIHLVLYGHRGRTSERILHVCDNHKIPFQQGAMDIFSIRCSYVGALKQILIGHDSTDIGDAWFLDSVTVEDPTDKQVYEFICNNWLSSRSDDKLTKRTLKYTASRKLESPATSKHEDDNEEEAEGAEADDAIKTVAQTNSPRNSVRSSGAYASTTHLNNDTETKASQTAGTSTDLPDEFSERLPLQRTEPAFTRKVDRYERQALSVKDDFESDIAVQSDGRAVSNKPDDSTIGDPSECRTAVFEEGSVNTPRTVRSEADSTRDFMDGFKNGVDNMAGQMAALQIQREKDAEQKASEEEKSTMFTFGDNIHQAARTGKVDRLKELLKHNEDLKDSKDEQGNSPLHLACRQGHTEIVRVLAANGAYLQERNQVGFEPIHTASLYGHVKCMMVLSAMGASINTKTDDSQTPMHLAAMSGHKETSKWLIANRAELDVEDNFGRTALDMASNNNHTNIVDLIRTCISEMKSQDRPSSAIRELRDTNKDPENSWIDDRNEQDSTIEDGSTADLRRMSRENDERSTKQLAYKDLQHKLHEDPNMTFLDLIRAEAGNG